MNIHELFNTGYTGNIAVTGDVVTIKGDEETLEFTVGEVSKNEKGIDVIAISPVCSYKTDKGKITQTAITAADLE